MNSRLVAGLVAGGVEAVGLSGIDGRTLEAEPHPDAARLGHVGRVACVHAGLINDLLDGGRVPVLSTIGIDRAGGTWNINADEAAEAVAVALGAETILFLSDVPAIVVDGKPVGSIDLDMAQALLSHADVTGGMKPKLGAATRAVERGVRQAIISTWSERGDLARLLLAEPGDGAPAADIPATTESNLFAAVYPLPRLELSHGSGCRVVDADGREYLDFVSGIAVNALGHADPGLRGAVHRQMGRLVHVSNLFGNRPAIDLAGRLLSITGYERVFLCNSGSEANEAALKFTRLHARSRIRGTGVIVAFEGSFHGRTAFALSATATPAYREPFLPLVPGIRFAPFDDAAAFDALLSELDAAGQNLDGVLIEPVQGEAGARVADGAFL
ncbi:MAG: acetylornithine/N-succinyldiaminopimelate aminotransferase, partial [bacterium]